LDGTLTELDWQAPAWSARRMQWLDRLIPPEARREQTRRLMINLEGFINFLISQFSRSTSSSLLERSLPLFNALRGYPPPEKLTLQPGALQALEHLCHYYKLTLITARDPRSLQLFFQESNIHKTLFHTIVTRQDVRNLLPHSEGLTLIVEQLQLQPEQMLVVSDSDVNLRAGRAMGMAAAGVLSGLGEAHDMRDADIVLRDVCELVEWV